MYNNANFSIYNTQNPPLVHVNNTAFIPEQGQAYEITPDMILTVTGVTVCFPLFPFRINCISVRN